MQKLLVATALAALLLLASNSVVRADTTRYDATAASVSDSCKHNGAKLASKTELVVSTDNSKIRIRISGLPELRGPLRKRGRFRVKATSGGRERSGRFSATGRANDGSIRLVLVAEFYKDGKALCTQSWNLVGKRR